MEDDGANGDGEAGDGVFGAILPAMPDGTVVEFYISASDGLNSRTWPAETNIGQVANAHYQVDDEVHRERPHASGGVEAKVCVICRKTLSRRDYLSHFKESHADVRLGCPKCPQTYHSPELLNVHYKHFHLRREEGGGGGGGASFLPKVYVRPAKARQSGLTGPLPLTPEPPPAVSSRFSLKA